ncbi:lysophosphatidic acid phosphatase type [Anaeramoeba flamelloides]|uniref:Lysophosphatidic acid phosphatase type n=1 Tax=Anaeramoeba flamelloides TaxID=1746091 RepID=A0AAV8ABH4_9EUKA|nr:lysophosphatidic acid phosphatase type [Anaeramoeba flamelloides]
MNRLSYFILISLIVLITTASKLEFAAVFTRHGDRTPIKNFPDDGTEWFCQENELQVPSQNLDTSVSTIRLYRKMYLPNRNVLPGNCTYGQLTTIGAKQHQELGKYFHSRYIEQYKILPEVLDRDTFWIRSTNYYRTLQSAEFFLYGLYPLESRSDQEIINIHTMDKEHENMHYNPSGCPKLSVVRSEIYKSKLYLDWTTSISPFLDKLKKIFNINDFDEHNLYNIYSNMEARKCHKKQIPDGLTEEIWQELIVQAGNYANLVFGNHTLNSLAIGTYIQELVDLFDSKISGELKHNFHLYSAHDSGIILVLSALHCFDNLPPEYASNLQFELFNINDSHYIQLLYNHKPLVIPGCGETLCPYEAFKQIALKAVLPDPHKSCQI